MRVVSLQISKIGAIYVIPQATDGPVERSASPAEITSVRWACRKQTGALRLRHVNHLAAVRDQERLRALPFDVRRRTESIFGRASLIDRKAATQARATIAATSASSLAVTPVLSAEIRNGAFRFT
jgi:hypothetical protein